MIMAPMAEIARTDAVAVVVLSWNGKDDTLAVSRLARGGRLRSRSR